MIFRVYEEDLEEPSVITYSEILVQQIFRSWRWVPSYGRRSPPRWRSVCCTGSSSWLCRFSSSSSLQPRPVKGMNINIQINLFRSSPNSDNRGRSLIMVIRVVHGLYHHDKIEHCSQSRVWQCPYLGSLSSHFPSTGQGAVDLSSEEGDSQVDGEVLQGPECVLVLQGRAGAEEVELEQRWVTSWLHDGLHLSLDRGISQFAYSANRLRYWGLRSSYSLRVFLLLSQKCLTDLFVTREE